MFSGGAESKIWSIIVDQKVWMQGKRLIENEREVNGCVFLSVSSQLFWVCQLGQFPAPGLWVCMLCIQIDCDQWISHLNISPSPLSMPFLAFPLSLSLLTSCFFFSFPVFSLSFLLSSLVRFVPLTSGFSEPDRGVVSATVDTESLPDLELSSVSSSTADRHVLVQVGTTTTHVESITLTNGSPTVQ